MNALGLALVWCVVQVTILASVASLLYGLVRRCGPSARALAAFAGLILIVGLTALTFSPWPRWQTHTDRPAPLGARLGGHVSRNSTIGLANGDQVEGDGSSDDQAVVVTGKSRGVPESPTAAAVFLETFLSEIQRLPATAESDSWLWPANVAVVFLAGGVLGLARLVAGLAAVRSYRLHARPITDSSLREMADILLAEVGGGYAISLCESQLLTTPATIGWRQPLIILPASWKSWTGTECRAVLAHEIAHIARHDFATWVAAQLALAVHFYHPLVHWLAARLRLEQELAADAAAARLSGGQSSYLTTLAGMALRQSDTPLAWPARTFLPTRGTFMRRIEMLRDEKLLSTKMSAKVRTGMIVTLTAVSLAVAGLRGTAADRKPLVDRSAAQAFADDGQPPAQDKDRTAPTRSSAALGSDGRLTGSVAALGAGSFAAAQAVEPLSLAYVPRDALAVAAFRPAELLSRPALAPLKKILTEHGIAQELLNVAADRIEQVTLIVLPDQNGPGANAAGFVLRLADAKDVETVIKKLQPNSEKQEYSGQTYVRGKDGKGLLCYVADERSIVGSHLDEYLRRLIVAGKNGAEKAKWGEAWKGAANTTAAVVVHMPAIRDMLNWAVGAAGEQPPNPGLPAALAAFAPFAPLWQSTSNVLLSVDLQEQLALSLELTVPSAEDLKKVRNTLTATVTLGQNSLSQARSTVSQLPSGDGAALLGIVDMLDSLLDSLKIEQNEHRVRASATVNADDAAKAIALVLPAVSNAREAARRAQSINNLKQLALAMHVYAEEHKTFPPAVLYSPDGKTAHSWRVAILPYLDQVSLYQQYRLDEPWDSVNNKKVLEKMPAVFRDPYDLADSTISSYFVLTGPTTVFFDKKGAELAKITDGTSNTLMIVEAKRDIPWTKPEDVPYDKEKPLPKLGGRYADVFLAAFCDGSVRAISQRVDERNLRGAMTRDGGEVIELSIPARN